MLGFLLDDGEPMLTPERLQELKKLCDEATPGPWTIYRRDDTCGLIKYDVENEKMQQVCFGQYDDVFKNTKQTSEFIAASRTALPELIFAYEQMDAKNALLEGKLFLAKVESEKLITEVERLRDEITNSNKFAQDQENKIANLIAEVERLKHEVAIRDYENMALCKFGVPAQNKEVDRLRKQLARCKEQRNQFRNSLSNSFNVIPSIKSLDAEIEAIT